MPTQAPEIDGVCYINDLGEGDAAPGEIRRLRITEAHDYDVVGELDRRGAAARPARSRRRSASSPTHEVSDLQKAR